MAADGPDFYDDENIFATYMRMRERRDSPNDTIEAPIINDLVGEVRGLRILDLGCGSATFGRQLLDRGAANYLGIEGSRRMAAAARETLAGTEAKVINDRVESWRFPSSSFDLVVSRLAVHYVDDVATLFASVEKTLVDGGRFVFSVEHPVITSCSRGWKEGTTRQDWIVDDYFSTGLRVTRWLGGEVRKYHRTVEDYVGAMRSAGFAIEQLREGTPRPDNFSDTENYKRRMRIPLFLIMAGTAA